MEEYCRDCKKNMEVVYDHFSGDTICYECGLVLEAHGVDDTCEWRSFAVECSTSEDRDPSRVGAASNLLLNHAHLSTIISKPRGKDADPSERLQYCVGSNPDQTLISGFESIAAMSDRLGIVKTIKDRACEIYKKVEDHTPIRKGKKRDATLAACLYIACNEEHKPRTLKEIRNVANGATEKEICRAKKSIENQFKEENQINAAMTVGATVNAGELVRRFCSKLSLNFKTMNAAEEAVKVSEQLDIRRTPITLVAAVIYMIIQLSSDDNKDIQDIATATGTSVNTIRNAYKDVHPYAARLIPSWYAPEKVIQNLNTV